MRSNAAAQKRVRQRKKAIIRAYKASQGCQECGERDVVVLDLHHRNPVEKHPTLGYHGGNKYMQNVIALTFADLRVELAKCDVLCANCHRRETFRQHADGAFTAQPRPDAVMPTLFDVSLSET